MSGASITAEPPPRAAPPEAGGEGRSRYRTGALFLLPAFILLGAWLVYPTIYTIVRSFFGPAGYLGTWVGIDNYRTLFTTSTLVTAIKNSAIWVAVVPAFVTAFGLLFAVLTERISWAVAFKTIIFLPMAISAFATGVTWRIMYQQNPDQGAINALGRTVSDAVTVARSPVQRASRRRRVSRAQGGGLVLKTPLHPGGVALLGLTGIAPDGHAAGSAAGGEAERAVRRDRGRRLARLQAGRRQARRRRAG